MRARAIELEITGGTAHDRAWLRRQVLSACAVLGHPASQLSIALVGDRVMAGLHRRFLGIGASTDVLTFELERDGRSRVTSGEIIICAPFARRAARRAGVPYRHELLLYAVHGLLHLCGYDDRTRRGFEHMHAAEDRILQRLGVGPVFAPRQRRGKTNR